MRAENLLEERSVDRDGMPKDQRVYRFANGYGASVVRGKWTYGYEDGLWELAVIKFTPDGAWSLTYDTPITDDVIGYLSEEQADELLAQIEALPARMKS